MDHNFGATNHMMECSNFPSYSLCAGDQNIKIVDGPLSAIVGKGSITIPKSLVLHSVIHVLNLSFNLLSISKLTCDLKMLC